MKKYLLNIFALAVGLIAAWWVFSQVSWVELGRVLAAANMYYLPPILLLHLLSYLLRALRWRYIIGREKKAGIIDMFTSIVLGNMANIILPARTGELVRAYLLGVKTGLSRLTLLATVFLERVLDSLVFLSFLGLSTFYVPLPNWLRSSLPGVSAICIALALGLLLLAFRPRAGRGLVKRLAQRIWEPLGRAVERVLQRSVEGVSSLRDPVRLGQVGLLSIIICLCEIIQVYWMAQAVGIKIDFMDSTFVLVIIAFASLILTAPAGMGTFEFFVLLALEPFLVPYEKAVALGILLHALMYLPALVLGALFLRSQKLSLKNLRGVKKTATMDVS